MNENKLNRKEIKEFVKLIGRTMSGPKKETSVGYGHGQFRIIYYLSQNKKAHPNELAEFLHVGTGRIGNVLKELEETNIIKRITDIDDRRKTTVILTDKGKAFAKKRLDEAITIVNKIIDEFGHDEFMNYIEKTNKLMDFIEKIESEEVDKCSKSIKI